GSGDHYRGAPDQWELCGYAVGAVCFFLALASLARPDRRRQRAGLWGLVLFDMVLALGPTTPLHRFLFDHLPLYGSMRCPARVLYVRALVGPLGAAEVLDCVLPKTGRRSLSGGLVVTLLAAERLFTWRGENPSVTLAETQARPPALDWLADYRGPGRMVND